MIPGAPKVLWPLYIECSDAEVILGSGPKGAEGGASTSLVATEGWEGDCHIVPGKVHRLATPSSSGKTSKKLVPGMEEILHQLVTIGNGETR